MSTRWVTAGAAGAAAGAAFAALHYAVHAPGAQLFGPSVYRGVSGRRSIALTFDDGPSEGSLPLLEYLEKQNVPATFFACGANVLRHPRIARSIAEAGHEIGNHTFSHPRLCPRFGWKPNLHSPAAIYRQFARTQKIVEDVAGVTPRLLRAPYGLRWYGMGAAQRQLGLLGVMWTVIGHDWEWPAGPVSDLVLRRASPGGIVCLHDGRDIQPNPDVSQMVLAVQRIVPELKNRGYSFETVSQLLRPSLAGFS
jgi:peptidoglycan/xylan/chitin deacetylase (PgdA/CDA1 family)